jgi:hypothetical protein
MTNGDDNSTTHDDDAAHWATAHGPEGSVDVRNLGLQIGELWIVGMSKDLHHDLQTGTTSPEEFNFLAREIVAAATPDQSPTPEEDDNTVRDPVRAHDAPERSRMDRTVCRWTGLTEVGSAIPTIRLPRKPSGLGEGQFRSGTADLP